ncbi:MAG: hypothetical protein IKS70_00285, partial [Bacteroides sp.]|nr:hypothetical protein [Bacteroides sp.]
LQADSRRHDADNPVLIYNIRCALSGFLNGKPGEAYAVVSEINPRRAHLKTSLRCALHTRPTR